MNCEQVEPHTAQTSALQTFSLSGMEEAMRHSVRQAQALQEDLCKVEPFFPRTQPKLKHCKGKKNCWLTLWSRWPTGLSLCPITLASEADRGNTGPKPGDQMIVCPTGKTPGHH